MTERNQMAEAKFCSFERGKIS